MSINLDRTGVHTPSPTTNVEINRLVDQIYKDLVNGTSTFEVVSSAPDVDDIDEGQIKLGESGGSLVLYSKVNGVVVHT